MSVTLLTLSMLVATLGGLLAIDVSDPVKPVYAGSYFRRSPGY